MPLMGEVPAALGPRGRGARSLRTRRRSCVRAADHRNARPEVISAAVRPRGPFSLRLSSRLAGDATRTFSSGPLLAALAAGGVGRAWQQPDGVVQLRAPDDRGIDELSLVLALDDDHSAVLGRPLARARPRARRPATAADRLERERGLGPWSVGVVCVEGLGRYERGLVGDLGLVKLCSALRGRWVEPWETAELLEPYGEWAGLASVYLLAAYRLGLVPLPREAAA